VIPVPGLAVPTAPSPDAARADSVQLFVERVRRVVPNFELNEQTLPGVVRLCQAIGGVPLIIELAAARAARATPDQIAELVRCDPDALDANTPDLPERHRSLHALFASVWTNLSNAEKNTLAQTTIFCEGFDSPAAKAIIAGDWNVEGALDTLVAQGLLQRDPRARLTLHPIVKYLLTEIIGAEPGDANLAARHSAYYLQLIAASESDDVCADLAQEWHNIARAWDWATEHPDPPALALALNGLMQTIARRGEFLQGARMVQNAITRLHRTTDDEGTLRATNHGTVCRLRIAQAKLLNYAGHYAEADQTLDQAAPLADEHDDALIHADLHLQRGNVALGSGSVPRARGEFESALMQARASFTRAWNDAPLVRIKHARTLIAETCTQLAECATRQKRVSAARQYADTAYDLYSDIGGASNQIRAALVYATFHTKRAEQARARKALSTMLTRAQLLGDWFLQANILLGLGQIEIHAKKWCAAQTQLTRALEIAQRMDAAPLHAAILSARACV